MKKLHRFIQLRNDVPTAEELTFLYSNVRITSSDFSDNERECESNTSPQQTAFRQASFLRRNPIQNRVKKMAASTKTAKKNKTIRGEKMKIKNLRNYGFTKISCEAMVLK